MKRVFAILLMTLILAARAGAEDRVSLPSWQLEPPEQKVQSPLASVLLNPPLAFGVPSRLGERPRLSVSLSPRAAMSAADEGTPAFSWSLDAWEMNTASLAHIQCSRATRTIESFLVEDCHFVDQPLPRDSANLVQVQGRWMAAPGLRFGAGAYSGRQPVTANAGGLFDNSAPGRVDGAWTEDIQGLNMNVSFGLSMGQVGSLLLDLQVERYRRTPEPFSLNQAPDPAGLGIEPARLGSSRYSNTGQLGVAWRGEQFGADLTGQYQELPYWMGERLEGEGFRSFDIEFSWRAPMSSSISVGVSNVLDRLPGASTAAEKGVEEAVDGIYGRIPYVRYKHDL